MPLFRSEMKRSNEIASSTLDKIKQDFDPAFSYMVFERAGPARKNAFLEVFEVLNRMDVTIHDLKTFHDPGKGKLLLVVKFDPGRSDRIMEEVFNAGLPEEIVFYGYGSPRSR